jgi:type III secretory pathway lipoprotein EscJ
MTAMKKVYTALNEADATLAQAALQDAGIQALVEPGALSNILGTVVASEESLPQVWVNDEDFDRAMQVLAEANFKRPSDAGRTKA